MRPEGGELLSLQYWSIYSELGRIKDDLSLISNTRALPEQEIVSWLKTMKNLWMRCAMS